MPRLSTLPQNKMTRANVRSVACPDCGAAEGTKCTGASGKPRSSSHAARWGAWRSEATGTPNPKEKKMATWSPEAEAELKRLTEQREEFYAQRLAEVVAAVDKEFFRGMSTAELVDMLVQDADEFIRVLTPYSKAHRP